MSTCILLTPATPTPTPTPATSINYNDKNNKDNINQDLHESTIFSKH
jgi:hypothetical protein